MATAILLSVYPLTSYNAPHLLGCEFEVLGTTVPNTSGSPAVISDTSGTVISANFFNSGAIDPIDGLEFVSVCVSPSDENGVVTAEISSDVGQTDNTLIKAYPQFVIGTKFGNQFETSFRFYNNSGLPQDQQWPVTATNLNDPDSLFQFANLEYVSQTRGVGLPAFTSDLPEIAITLDIDEINVVGSERDVMLESWFYDTSANADMIGSNTVTGAPVANTLNNIVSIGHPHFPELDNVLLEMMVHVGALSPNDISRATRNPGQNQLTETFSGKDTDGDGIDDHFDVDSHVNINNNQDPQPGKYSSGVDDNGDGIDDADFLPITIGSYKYSIWYGETFISPNIIFSRETNASLQSNFDPLTPDMDLSAEGEITLPWNDFLEYTLNILEARLQQQNQIEIALKMEFPEFQRTLPWMDSNRNPFPKMASQAGAIGGVEFGVEPQTNGNDDLPYSAIVNTFSVTVDGNEHGLNADFGISDDILVVATCNGLSVTVDIGAGDSPTSGADVILGTAGNDVINGLGGDDTICGMEGSDVINAGNGNDWVDAGPGNDTVEGGNGDDEIYGDSGVDILNGGPNDDEIFGEAGGDFINGNSGDDLLDGGDGVDQLRGGSGDDVINTGSGGNRGTGLVVTGGAGNDIITGGPGTDEIRGESGNDTILGGDDSDSLFGGGGNDIVNGQDGDDILRGNGSRDTVLGGEGNDDMDGGDSDDIMSGGNGNDIMRGATGNDEMSGGAGNDQMFGGGGNDAINGNRGDDMLFGGGSNDTLNGGSDADSCSGDGGTDSAVSCELQASIP